jgi:transcriptional regulator with XRE-family HTH domain
MDKYKTGNFIYSLRKEKGISQGQLGLMLVVTNKAVSKWENGDNKPEVNMLYRLSDVLGVSADELVRGERNTKINEIETTNENLVLKRRLEQARREKKEEDKKYWLTQIYLLVVVTIFFALSYVATYPIINFSTNPLINVLEGVFNWIVAPCLLLASFVSGFRLLTHYLKVANPVMNIVMLTFFPLTIVVFLLLGLVFLIPSLVKSYKEGFFPKQILNHKQKSLFISYLVSLGLIILVAVGLLLFEYLANLQIDLEAIVSFDILFILFLFIFIAIDTIIYAILAHKQELL